MSAEVIGLLVVAAMLALALILKGSGDPTEQHRPTVLPPEQRFEDVDALARRARINAQRVNASAIDEPPVSELGV